ncbi:sigma-70 family RNA polymerase sigma factor [Ottowia cancrivicina]|uniref:Sigma-70 family RNA polymerase sigma factor n=1 Tax=Ottowia cancrivicina TaxID=3040346 RepID=A0AAW6RD18_9BURK|nr:sigma-70 family RNA polymerase sigma factor [Ottowia sp. 10c7w1]MDG9698278.1 sigma-70 family RNA polymerase sigma factor [Ottowia sp. 10c7w1]
MTASADPASAWTDAGALARAWRAPLLRFARLHLQPDEEAEDAVQDTLLAVLAAPAAAPPRGGGPRQGDARGYLFGILKHKITDRLRARYRHGTPPAASATAGGADALDAELFDSRGHWQTGAGPALWHDPESQLQNSQFFAVLEACVSKLPPKPARVFSMKELLDCDADEICATLAITRADYWQCMSRARKQLQLCLGQNWFASPPPAPRKERP